MVTDSPETVAAGPSDLPVHAVEPEAVFAAMGTSPDGLSAVEARRRLDRYGPNVVPKGRRESPLKLLWRQINSPLIWVLIASGIVAMAVDWEGEGIKNGVVILAVVAINSLIGFVQEFRASRAIELCRAAGITVKMITGDHRATAAAIGQQLGILTESGALSGGELSQMDHGQLDDAAGRVNVFARVAPEHKLRLVRSLQSRGEVVFFPFDRVSGELLLALSPIQLLWINLVATVSLPLPLAFEAREPDVLVGAFTNKMFYVGVLLVLALQAVFIYLPPANRLFGSTPLKLDAWLAALAVGVIILPVMIFEKLVVQPLLARRG